MSSTPNVTTKPKRYSPLTFWCHSHLQAMLASLGALLRTPIASIMTIFVFAVAMALPIAFMTLLHSLAPMQAQWQQPKITLYLQQNITDDARLGLMQQLQQNKLFSQVDYVSPAQGLLELTSQSQLPSTIINQVQNPLPPVMVLTLAKSGTAPAQLQQLQQQVNQLPGVQSTQLNLHWLERLYYIATILQRLALGLAGLLSVGLFFVIANTMRLVLQSHKPEIRLLNLIGATHAFIRRPLLYRGLWLSLSGAICAWALVFVLMNWLAGPLAQLAATYGLSVYAQFFDGKLIIDSCVLAGVIGVSAAWFVSVHKHNAVEE